MIPIRLVIQAFGPFLERQTVDFERLGQHGLFVIHGPTGSGKSTILDALTYALYDKASGEERQSSDVIALARGDQETRVELTFRHMGRTYRVERTPRQTRPKKRGEGTTVAQPEARLYDLTDGREELLHDGSAQVGKAVEEMLKCDATQFRQTVVLPQGDFRRVLTDVDTRETTLKRLFDTRRFAEVERRTKAYAKKLRDEVAELHRARGELLEKHDVATREDLEAAHAVAAEALAAAGTARAEQQAAFAAAVQAKTAGEELAKRFATLREVEGTLQRLATETTEIDALRARLARHADADRQGHRVDAWRETQADLEQRRAEHAAAATALEASETAYAEAERLLAAHRENTDAIDKDRASLEDRRRARGDVDRLAQAIADADAAQERLDQTKAEHAQREEALRTAEAELEAARARLEEARTLAALRSERETALTAAKRRETDRARIDEHRTATRDLPPGERLSIKELLQPFAGALAARLEPGEPCPVCGSEHAHAPDEHDLAQADAAVREVLLGVDEEILHRAKAQAAIDAILAVHDWDEDDLPTPDDLSTATREAQARFDEAETARRTAEALAEEVTRRTHTVAEAQQALADASKAVTEADKADTRTATVRDEVLSRVPEGWRDPTDFAEALTILESRITAFDTRTTQLEQALRQAGEDRARHQATLEAAARQVRDAESHVTTTETAMRSALTTAGFVDADGNPDLEAFDAARLSDADREALADRVASHDQAVADASSRRTTLQESIDGQDEPDLPALEQARADAEVALDAANEAFRDADTTHRTLDADLTEVRRLESTFAGKERAQRTAQHLADVLNGSQTGQVRLGLERHVLRQILNTVLANANRQLERMTGRYRLRVTERDAASTQSLDLDVEDAQAGLALRKVSTLSGGEGFQASLALALGLSEAAERTSGAVELGALFIDEGFGSLDQDALIKVTQVLRRLPEAQNRMVGVITHVDALKDRLDAQLLVSRTEAGSRIEHRVG